MKLTLVGAGVRSPLFTAAAVRRAPRIGLDELCLMDIDADRLEIFTDLARQEAREGGSRVRITSSTDAEEALDGAGHVVTTIRVGGEEGRILDERIALEHGILGQETTGPGGFAMALRNVPAILRYAELLDLRSPNAWLYSFTNPAGLVAQALRDEGFSRVIGICDGANEAQRAVARFIGVDASDLRAEVFGLNHLSWARRVTRDGVDLLPGLLVDPAFRAATKLGMFDRELIDMIGMWPNPYLYYFYYAERAVAEIAAGGATRGEEIRDLTMRLLDDLASAKAEDDPARALEVFRAYHRRRRATYMGHARSNSPSFAEADRMAVEDTSWGPSDEEGYAAVMLDVVEALETGVELHTALNVPNAGAIDGIAPNDIVEVSCRVSGHVIETMPIGTVPAAQLALMQAIKSYERLTVRAIKERSRDVAIEALMTHPLVLSYPRASHLVDEYLAAHQASLDWT